MVFDSSAVIALLNKEVGADFIAGNLSNAVVSAVNVQEVAKKMIEAGVTIDLIRDAIGGLEIRVLVHDDEDALAAASLAPVTKRYGKGLGDRSCMALAIRLGVPALTTDRDWSKLDIPGLEVVLAR